MNDNELDPCIAAEVRMKKALFSPRYVFILKYFKGGNEKEKD